ncbi:hypothetical protein SERLA73DRAFT_175801 [Serpula lacrymans var. lacrymans S7.3]|uniref:NADP-dependent oxidoreductase domain-containing protein n=2 Tax=Serpula lacrymans var. lacrymans TaxID=341189 RepID=F8PIW6_SERL3|nr:uncharacterized protein SERLADRAFT_458408 [Serpula lacrymans var. lacrymans S7.9]EGO04066.1 hypothetical protein SERLA73DRAFT_175801 [Serpula lacrymans var. lacrymans S7.3]EGO29983.1 hypothetical protein SERLADRAFT_458408 [Serpula lacrymans var. lacrymans S7.9]
MSTPLIKLNSGFDIPAVGFGTWQSKPNEVSNAVEVALRSGYRHIDCAWLYGNEKEVGEGIRASGVPRSEIFITSKVWCTFFSKIQDGLDQTLANLGTDYVDLYLLHWPVALNPNGNHPVFPMNSTGTFDVDASCDLESSWKGMEALLKDGKVKSIGVSNFSQKKLEELLPKAEIVPAVNQLELNIYNPELKLVEYVKSKGIVVEAYSPLGSTNSPLLSDEIATQIANKHAIPVPDVLLGYILAKGMVVLPKSVTPSRIESNLKGALGASQVLTQEDIEKLDSVAASGKQKRFLLPPFGVDLGFDNWP